jgi:hypothetical protein
MNPMIIESKVKSDKSIVSDAGWQQNLKAPVSTDRNKSAVVLRSGGETPRKSNTYSNGGMTSLATEDRAARFINKYSKDKNSDLIASSYLKVHAMLDNLN